MRNEYSKEQIEKNFNIILGMEYLGIHIEDTKEEKGNFGFTTKTIYYYSVPESSTIEVDNKELNAKIKTSDGLKLLAKESLTDMLIDSCKDAYPDDEEFIKDIKDNKSEYFAFYAKIRSGEVWNEDMGKSRVKELCEDIKKASEYKEI